MSEAEKGKKYILEEVSLCEPIEKRLLDLGITRGCRVEVLNKKPHGVMAVRVRGTRFAVGKMYADGIVVREKV